MIKPYPLSALANVPYPLNYADPLAKGLVGQWLTSGGGGGTAWDRSGRGNNGTLTGFAVPFSNTSGWACGRDGSQSAVALDGTDDYISIPYTPSIAVSGAGQNHTYSFWAKLVEDKRCELVDNSAGGTYRWTFWYLGGNNWQAGPYDGTNFPVVSWIESPALGVWQLYNFTRLAGVTNSVYSNGVLLGSTADTTGNCNNTGITTLGFGRTDASRYVHGSIEAFRIYNRALSSSEILTLCNSPRRQLRYRPQRQRWKGATAAPGGGGLLMRRRRAVNR